MHEDAAEQKRNKSLKNTSENASISVQTGMVKEKIFNTYG